MKLPKEGTNELSKDGYDWIALKILFVRSERSDFAFFVILTILSETVQQYWSAAHLFCIMRPLWGDANTVTKYGDCGISINVLYARPERSNLDLCYLFGLIFQKQCMIWPKFVWNTYRKSYMIFQFGWPFGWSLKVKSRSQNFQKAAS
jgi:hypothetical protein